MTFAISGFSGALSGGIMGGIMGGFQFKMTYTKLSEVEVSQMMDQYMLVREIQEKYLR